MPVRKPRGRWVPLLIGVIIGIVLINIGVSLSVLKRLEKKAGTPIRGIFLPHLFHPSFTLKDSRLNWQGQFQILSGTFRVRYDPWFFFRAQRLRTQIEGWDVAVQFSGELAQSQGLGEALIDHVQADFAFSGKRTPEIFLLDVRSPQLQFHLMKERAKAG